MTASGRARYQAATRAGRGPRGQRDQEAPQEDAQAQEEEAAQALAPQEALSLRRASGRPPSAGAGARAAAAASAISPSAPAFPSARPRRHAAQEPSWRDAPRAAARPRCDARSAAPPGETARSDRVVPPRAGSRPAVSIAIASFFLRFLLDEAENRMLASAARVALEPRNATGTRANCRQVALCWLR